MTTLLQPASFAFNYSPSVSPVQTDRVTVAIVGSATLSKSEIVELRTHLYWQLRSNKWRIDKVVSGGAAGVDTMAEQMAIKFRLPFEKFLPLDENGKRASGWPYYKARNIQIAEACDVLWRFVSPNTRTYGSGWTRDYAHEALGKPTREWVLDGSEMTTAADVEGRLAGLKKCLSCRLWLASARMESSIHRYGVPSRKDVDDQFMVCSVCTYNALPFRTSEGIVKEWCPKQEKQCQTKQLDANQL